MKLERSICSLPRQPIFSARGARIRESMKNLLSRDG
jgi:hypothetical protein